MPDRFMLLHALDSDGYSILERIDGESILTPYKVTEKFPGMFVLGSVASSNDDFSLSLEGTFPTPERAVENLSKWIDHPGDRY